MKKNKNKKKRRLLMMPRTFNMNVKLEISEMLKHLGISKTYFKKTMPSVSGSTKSFVRVPRGKGGHKPSLVQQRMILRELVTTDKEMKQTLEEQKEHILEDQAAKSAMQEGGEKVATEHLKGMISSVFDRND